MNYLGKKFIFKIRYTYLMKYTKNEIRDLIIALIITSVSFAISNVGMDLYGMLSIFPIVTFGVSLAFLSRELGHKFVSIKYGYHSEFKAQPVGLLITFLTSFIGFVFAIPGTAVTNDEDLSDEMKGKIAIAGPMTNIAYAIIFILIAALIYPFKIYSDIFTLIFLICVVGYSVNSYLAAFNLLPVDIQPVLSLDGGRVFKWNKLIWIIVFVIAGIMTLLSMTVGAENMVKILIGA